MGNLAVTAPIYARRAKKSMVSAGTEIKNCATCEKKHMVNGKEKYLKTHQKMANDMAVKYRGAGKELYPIARRDNVNTTIVGSLIGITAFLSAAAYMMATTATTAPTIMQQGEAVRKHGSGEEKDKDQ